MDRIVKASSRLQSARHKIIPMSWHAESSCIMNLKLFVGPKYPQWSPGSRQTTQRERGPLNGERAIPTITSPCLTRRSAKAKKACMSVGAETCSKPEEFEASSGSQPSNPCNQVLKHTWITSQGLLTCYLTSKHKSTRRSEPAHL